MNRLKRLCSAWRDRQNRARLNRLLESRRSSVESPIDLFGGVDDEFWFWLHTQGFRTNPALQRILPKLPDETTQQRFCGQSGDAALASAFSAYRLFKRIVEENLGELADCRNILDFGCGWGRMLRFFLKDLPPSRLWGIDYLGEMIETCRQTNPWCNFRRVDAMPPTEFASGTFDVVYCFSVFSHLSEEAHRQWLHEFARIMKPGGVLIATTREREFIKHCAKVRQQADRPFYVQQLASAFRDTKHWLATYDRGGYCHSPGNGSGTLNGSFFGNTCIPRDYVAKHWTDRFIFVDYLTDCRPFRQDVIVVKNHKEPAPAALPA